jgi:hypothetical protein
MRYRVGDDPASGTTVTDDMVLVTVVIGLIVGIVLVWLAQRGRQMWLLVWSTGLVLASLAYIAWTALA